ncbi:MAG: sugar phosphate isomerase/epimerase family protein [Candidatus Merdivicinus sp.]|jgi:sugar phosphate isomerase/epimerase
MKMGFQISSVRAYLSEPKQTQETIQKLACMGWKEMQMQWIAPEVPDEVVAESLKQNGIHAIGVQDKTDAVRQNLERMITQNHLWGGRYLTTSGIPADCFTTEGLKCFAEELQKLEQRLQSEGMLLTFHPIYSDYVPVDGKPAAEILLDLMPEMQLTLCVYHAVKGAVDPCRLLRKYAGRTDIVHLKNSVVLSDGREALMPVGQGNINWPPILDVCRETGVKWVLAEQERWEKDAFLCMKESYDYLKGLELES